MTSVWEVNLVLDAWESIDKAVAGLEPDDATKRWFEGSSFAWTYVHVTNQVDAWLNVRFQGLKPHALVGSDVFRRTGSGGAEDWQAIVAGVEEVRARALPYMETLREDQLEERHPYEGSIEALRSTGISLRHALLRIAAHHYYHVGEIAAKREMLGHDVGDFPGNMSRTI
jgi:hypothetical protein